MSSKITVVKSLRASREFFDKCDLVAKAEGVDRNKLIVGIVSEYCEKKLDKSCKNCEHFVSICVTCSLDIVEKYLYFCNKNSIREPIRNINENKSCYEREE